MTEAMHTVSILLHLRHTAVYIVVDLSNLGEMWFTLETLLGACRARIESIINDMKQEHPNIRDTLRRQAWERLGEDQPDKNMMDPFLIPLVIVGSKYDVFQVMSIVYCNSSLYPLPHNTAF